MNKKVMAIMMASVMMLSAIVIMAGYDHGTDATGTGTYLDPKIIMGESTEKPYKIYTDQVSGVNASIEFNEAAFSSKRVVSLTVNEKKVTLGTAVDLVSAGVTITKDGNSGNDIGKYTVNFKGKAATDSTLEVMIKLIVKDYSCSFTDDHTHSTSNNVIPGCIALPEQVFYYKAFIKVFNNTGEDFLSKGTLTPASGSDESATPRSYALKFEFETTYDITASVKEKESDKAKDGYRFYATGLPSGISMTVDGHIGGKISNTHSTGDNNTAYVYAVSGSGKVYSVMVTWSIGTKSIVGDYTIDVTVGPVGGSSDSLKNNTNVTDKGYITMEQGQEMIVTFKADSNSEITDEKVTFNGNVNDNGPFKFTAGGTGVFEVTVSAIAKTKNSEHGFEVQKTFTVYVVGQIVDADLDPSVTSN